MNTIPDEKKLVLFDGVCNLCNNSVLKIIRYDTKNTFVFVSLQSKLGQKIITDLKIDTSKIDSIILYESNTSYYIKSSAVLKIMKDFGGFWSMTEVFWVIPAFLRNIIYDFIAKNRYKWFGKKDNCMIPTKELKAKFLDS